MGKLKWAILEAGATKSSIEAEFATGSLWYQGCRVSGGGTSHHEGCTAVQGDCAGGDVGAEVLQVWTPIKGFMQGPEFVHDARPLYDKLNNSRI